MKTLTLLPGMFPRVAPFALLTLLALLAPPRPVAAAEPSAPSLDAPAPEASAEAEGTPQSDPPAAG